MAGAISASKRIIVMMKTNFQCAYCGVRLTMKTGCIDHIHPRIAGGSHEESNLHAACRPCNTVKGHRDIEDFRLHMAARLATDGPVFHGAQLRYLRDKGLLEALGINTSHKFFFETLLQEDESANGSGVA